MLNCCYIIVLLLRLTWNVLVSPKEKKKNSSMAMKDLVTLESCCLKVTTL